MSLNDRKVSNMNYQSDYKVVNQLIYNRVKSAIPAYTNTVLMSPTNQSIYDRSNNIIDIPISTSIPNAVLDNKHSYLTAKLTYTGTDPVYFDGGFHSIIKKFSITQSGNYVENVDYYNTLVTALQNMGSSNDYTNTMTILGGFPQKQSEDGFLIPIESKTVSSSTTPELDDDRIKLNSGRMRVEPGQTIEICLPLLSAFLNAKYTPIYLFGSQHIHFQLQLEDFNRAFVKASHYDNKVNPVNDGVFSITNVVYNACIISIQDPKVSMMLAQASQNNALDICGSSWNTYTNSLPASLGDNVVLNITDRSSSLRTLMTGLYLQNSNVYYSNHQSGWYNIRDYRLSLAGTYIPSNSAITVNSGEPNSSMIQPFIEYLRMSSGGFYNIKNTSNVTMRDFSVNNPNTVLTKTGGSITLATANKIYTGTAMMCVTLENFSGSGDAFGNGLESGFNSKLSNTPIQLIINRDCSKVGTSNDAFGYTKVPDLLAITYALRDVIWHINAMGLIETKN